MPPTIMEITAPGRPAPLWVNLDTLLYVDTRPATATEPESLLLVFQNPGLGFTSGGTLGAVMYALANPDDIAHAKAILSSLNITKPSTLTPTPATEIIKE